MGRGRAASGWGQVREAPEMDFRAKRGQGPERNTLGAGGGLGQVHEAGMNLTF